MKLISHVSLRLSIAITLILSIWAVLFYFTMIDEINDEMDDSLEDYSETIIIRALSGEQLPSKNNGSNNQYYLTIENKNKNTHIGRDGSEHSQHLVCRLNGIHP